VTVGLQTLRALVHSGGTWNIRPAALTDGTVSVSASVRDPAGNEGTDTQALTVDTTAPAVAIAGGTSALTNDPTPHISGTADVAPGTAVTVDLADETLTTAVGDGGSWSVSASALSDGPHRVVVSVSDAAGNPARAVQTLTVDTVRPAISITGGGSATTDDLAPTITGTSDATPGTTITVTISGQTMTTLLQANGSWNTTPTFVGEGTWSVVASAPDPAGNVGSANQTLTIAVTADPAPPSETPLPPPSEPPPSAPPPSAPTPTPPPPYAPVAVDSEAPETTITRQPPNRTHAGRVAYRFISSEAGSRFECKIDKSAFKSCTSSKKLRVTAGNHRFKVRAIDEADNTDPTPATDKFTAR
jgi:hypothetical protein